MRRRKASASTARRCRRASTARTTPCPHACATSTAPRRDTLQSVSAWSGAKLRPIAQTTELAPGVWVIATVSDVPGTRELRELSLAVRTSEGFLLVVGCSHPGLPVIVAEAAKLDPDIHLVIGGFHYVDADDAAIAGVVDALEPYAIDFIAPGHCTGEATFAALQRACGDRHLYAGRDATRVLDSAAGPDRPCGAAAAFDAAQRTACRALALRGHHAHDHHAARWFTRRTPTAPAPACARDGRPAPARARAGCGPAA